MNLFFDTSALVKYFYYEMGTEQVSALIENPDNSLWILELARTEFLSALLKKYRTREIGETQLQIAIEGFESTVCHFHIEPLGHIVTQEAEKLLKKYGRTEGLRTLDALQLGAFVLLVEAEDDWQFIVADKTLAYVAQCENYSVITIISHGFPT